MLTALKTMAACFPASVEWTRPTGGYTIWVKMPRKLKENELADLMEKHRVFVSPGLYFFFHEGPSEYFRICIAKTDEKEITQGLSRLGRALKTMDKRNTHAP